MNCYLCKSSNFHNVKGKVRDNPYLSILECANCKLVFLSSLRHIDDSLYKNSGMHGIDPISMESWLKDTQWDDLRRFEMVKSMLPNKQLLDFGCGAAGFLQHAQLLAAEVKGIELEDRVREYWAGKINIVSSIEDVGGTHDLITAFHVV